MEITRQITKHNYLVTNLEDLPRIMREAFFLANSGRPVRGLGPTRVHIRAPEAPGPWEAQQHDAPKRKFGVPLTKRIRDTKRAGPRASGRA